MSGSGGGGRGGRGPDPGALGGLPLDGISEVILVVKDVARSVEFYRDVVGLLPERIGSPKFAWFWAGPAGRSQRIGITTGPLAYGAAHCGGPQHFAFGTSKARIPALKAALERQGLEVEGPVEFPSWDAHSIYFSDPDGNRIELCGFGGGKSA